MKYRKARVYQEVVAIIVHDLMLPVNTADDETLDTVEDPEIGGRAASRLMLPGVGSGFEEVRHHKIIRVEWEELPPDDEPDDDDHQLDCRTQGDLS